MLKRIPTAERAREVLRIDGEGRLIWAKTLSQRAPVGTVAWDGINARKCVGLDGVRYVAVALRYLHMTGMWPTGFVDAGTGTVFAHRSADPRVVTADALRDALHYDPTTGRFTWKQRTSKCVRIGDEAGSPTSTGYMRARLFGVEYLLHRLAWVHTHGKWPDGQIDHINGDRTDNRIANLRDVSHRTNQENQRTAMSSNRLGVLGVTRRSQNSYQAAIKVDGETLHVGSYSTPHAAHAAYIEAKRRLHVGCTL